MQIQDNPLGPPPSRDLEDDRLRASARRALFGDDAGFRVGRFELCNIIGSGGVGTVYSAVDTDLERPVALKVLQRNWEQGGLGSPEHLLEEAKTLARLGHPNVVTVHEVGRHGDDAFIAMELVDGPSLRSWVEAQGRSRRSILDVLICAGRGLAAAHDAGLVHRDFKPDNVVVGHDTPKVVDFGLACARHAPSSTENFGGTPGYAAPEQLRGEPIDARADQYSFAVTAFEVLTGTRPTPDDAPRRGLPRRIHRVLSRAMQSDPSRRWPDATRSGDEVAQARLAANLLLTEADAADPGWVSKRADVQSRVDRADDSAARAMLALADLRHRGSPGDVEVLLERLQALTAEDRRSSPFLEFAGWFEAVRSTTDREPEDAVELASSWVAALEKRNAPSEQLGEGLELLGWAQWRAGRHEDALSSLQRALPFATRPHRRASISAVRARVELALGNFARARDIVRVAEQERRDLEYAPGPLDEMGRPMLMLTNGLPFSMRVLQIEVDARCGVGPRPDEGVWAAMDGLQWRSALADSAFDLQQGRLEKAVERLDILLESNLELPSPEEYADYLDLRAAVEAKRGQRDVAIEHLEHALENRLGAGEERHAPFSVADTRAALARQLVDQAPERALDLAWQALATYRHADACGEGERRSLELLVNRLSPSHPR